MLLYFPGKDHDYGLVTYIAAQKLLWTRLAIPIAFEPHTPSNRLSPIEAFHSLLQQLPHNLASKFHVVADSTFGGIKTVRDFSTTESGFGSISGNSPSGVYQLISLMGESLPENHSCTFQCDDILIQATQGSERVTSIISNACTISAEVPPPLPHNCSYKTANFLYKNESPATIVKLCKLSLDTDLLDPINVVKEATGWNVSLPEKAQQDIQMGIILTNENLKSMTSSNFKLYTTLSHLFTNQLGLQKMN